MHLLGLEIKRDRREKQYSMMYCYSCGSTVFIPKDKLRVYNYCNTCSPRVV